MTAPVMFLGDLHLGRSPQRLRRAGLDPNKLGPVEGWRRVVQYAVSKGVQAVVLSGDVVDQDKDRFEAWGHLRHGVEEMTRAGVRVLGVAGNHDHIALPRLAERIRAFRLIGRDGVWQREELDGIDLLGWSFPSGVHRESPLLSPGLKEAIDRRRPDAALVGVLHGDLDATESPYAPVRRAALAEHPVAGWFLGHVHKPDDLGRARPMGYLGSLVGLDRSETGRRGPWLVQRRSASAVEATQLRLGPVHWTTLEVDLTGVHPGPDVNDQIHARVETVIERAAAADRWTSDGDFLAVGCSVVFTGPTAARAAIQQFIENFPSEELVFEARGLRWAVVHLSDATTSSYDLPALAAERSPLGQVAQLLLDLDAKGPEAIPAEVRAAIGLVKPEAWSTDIARDPMPDPLATTRAAALRLLDQLMDQRVRRGAS